MHTSHSSTATPGRRQFLLASAVAAGGLALGPDRAPAASDDGISRSAEAIHQEVVFKAVPKRIYEALTDASEFQKMEALSAAMKNVDVGAHPAVISREPGGTFSLFGGYIAGRQIELVPFERIVQAWRTTSWAPGLYSIARFALAAEGSSTRLVFDHTGFPAGAAEHLAAGWKSNYWEPLEKFLG
jgi:activator of HSP90 ATPase